MSSISGYGGTAAADMLAQMRARMFAKADANADGSIDKSEFEAGPQRPGGASGTDGTSKKDELFAKIDGDGDGKLTKDEFKAFDQKISSEMQSLMLSLQGAGGPPPPPPPEESSFDDADSTDSASSVDSAESASQSAKSKRLDELFAKIDTDGDGKLTKDELETFDEQMRTKFKTALLSAQEETNGTTGGDGTSLAQLLARNEDAQKWRGSRDDQQDRFLRIMLQQLAAV